MTVKILHYLSMTGTFMALYGLLYLILRYTIGWIPLIRNTTIWSVPIEIPIFSITVVLIIARYIEISSPYAGK